MIPWPITSFKIPAKVIRLYDYLKVLLIEQWWWWYCDDIVVYAQHDIIYWNYNGHANSQLECSLIISNRVKWSAWKYYVFSFFKYASLHWAGYEQLDPLINTWNIWSHGERACLRKYELKVSFAYCTGHIHVGLHNMNVRNMWPYQYQVKWSAWKYYVYSFSNMHLYIALVMNNWIHS